MAPLPLLRDGTPPPDYEYDLELWMPVREREREDSPAQKFTYGEILGYYGEGVTGEKTL